MLRVKIYAYQCFVNNKNFQFKNSCNSKLEALSMKRIFYNGRMTTLDPSTPFAEAIYVENGQIVAVGTNDEILL